MKSWTRIMHVCSHFSGFSVGCCINREKVYLLPTWVREIADVSTECSSRHQSESGRSVNNVAIYSQALLRIHVIGGQRSVRIALPFLSPHHSSPATRDFQSSISVEALFCRCHLDVQGLLYQQLLSFAVVQYGGLLPGTQQDNHLSSQGYWWTVWTGRFSLVEVTYMHPCSLHNFTPQHGVIHWRHLHSAYIYLLYHIPVYSLFFSLRQLCWHQWGTPKCRFICCLPYLYI